MVLAAKAVKVLIPRVVSEVAAIWAQILEVMLTQAAMQAAIALAARLTELHSSLSTDQHYLARVTNQERQPAFDDEAMISK